MPAQGREDMREFAGLLLRQFAIRRGSDTDVLMIGFGHTRRGIATTADLQRHGLVYTEPVYARYCAGQEGQNNGWAKIWKPKLNNEGDGFKVFVPDCSNYDQHVFYEP